MDEKQEWQKNEQVASRVCVRAKTLIETGGHWASRQLRCVCKSLSRLTSATVCVCLCACGTTAHERNLTKGLMQEQCGGYCINRHNILRLILPQWLCVLCTNQSQTKA